MRTKILILCCTLGILCSCNSQQKEKAMSAVANEQVSQVNLMAPAPSYDKTGENRLDTKREDLNDKTVVNKQKIIKDGNITVKSSDINASKKGIDHLLKTLNAYYENEDLQNNEQSISYTLKIRIPAAHFEKLIVGIENGKDKIESKNIQTRDVTEEYVDIETRLANKRDYLKRYKELLSKALTVKDILAIEQNISSLQEEIESKEGRLNYLKDQISFSTLNISLYKEKEFTNNYQDSFLTRVKTAVIQGWTSIVDFVLWAIGIWPYLIIIPAVFFVIRKIIRTRKNRQV